LPALVEDEYQKNDSEFFRRSCSYSVNWQLQDTQTIYWILAASKGWIKQTYRKIMHTQNHITGNDLVQIEQKSFYND